MKETLAWSEYCKSFSPAIVESCSRAAVAGGPAALVKELAKEAPDWHFRHVLTRGGWYRLGGVVAADGSRIADKLEAWVQQGLDEHGGDFGALADAYAGQTLYATRLVGQTHYLVAPAGQGADDFLQLEVEVLQETRAHRLFDGEALPTTVDELVDPPGITVQPLPLGLPFYAFRRLLHVGSFLKRMLDQRPEPAPLHRMVADWENSSAGATCAFHNQWIIATREHLDRYQQPVLRAQPIATFNGSLPDFSADRGTNGTKLQAALTQFDKAVGYPMAWYFHMLSGKAVPHWVAQTVVEDALGGFAYLPQRDVDVVRHWLHQPYSV